MILNMAGGGGSDGKIYVVGGTTQPSSPKENTIWVNTSVTITSWTMQYDQPSNPTQGTVWIMTAAYSNAALNPFSKMNAYFYPISAKIYNSGSWVRCGGSVYTNNTWYPMRVYFYDSGDECTIITGGWTAGGTNPNFVFTKGSDSLYLQAAVANNTVYSMYTINTIDLTNISTLHFKVKYDVNGSSGYCSVNAVNSSPSTSDYNVGTYNTVTMNLGVQTVSVDVSSLSGNYYIRLTLKRDYNDSDAYLYELYGD